MHINFYISICMLNHLSRIVVRINSIYRFYIAWRKQEDEEERKKKFMCENLSWKSCAILKHFEGKILWWNFSLLAAVVVDVAGSLLSVRWEFTSLRILCDGIIIIIAFFSPALCWHRQRYSQFSSSFLLRFLRDSITLLPPFYASQLLESEFSLVRWWWFGWW